MRIALRPSTLCSTSKMSFLIAFDSEKIDKLSLSFWFLNMKFSLHGIKVTLSFASSILIYYLEEKLEGPKYSVQNWKFTNLWLFVGGIFYKLSQFIGHSKTEFSHHHLLPNEYLLTNIMVTLTSNMIIQITMHFIWHKIMT